VPRLAQRRVILFFCPMRASSENQTSIAAGSTPFSRAISSRRAGKLFYILDGSLGLRMVTRASGELAIAHGPKFSAQGLLGDRDAELLEDPLAKIDDPPAYDTMYGGDRPALDDRGKRCPVCIVEPRGLSGRFAVDQPFGAMGVELHYPSRTICSVTPPIFAASERAAPS
jgi:hypothetical protein